jgi:uncharacterized protein (DUF433 family)
MTAIEISPGVVVDPEIRVGKPVIKGTRVPVDLIIGKLAGGESMDAVAEAYELTLDQIRDALGYAAMILEEDETRATA